MKLIPRAPVDDVNAPSESPVKTVSGLLIGAVVIVGLFFLIVTTVVDVVVDALDPVTEVELFAEMVPEMLASFEGRGFDEEAEAALAPIFERVRAAGPELPYEFTVKVACESEPNALALPGGGVLVTSGLLNIVDTEEELIFILGHELGHFVHRDHLRGMGRGLALQLMMSTMLLTTGIDPTVGLQLALEAMSSSHSREQEIAADATGLLVLHALHPEDISGANRALVALHSKLGESALDALDFFRSHPIGPKRIKALEERVKSEGYPHNALQGTPLPKALQENCGSGGLDNNDTDDREQGDADAPADTPLSTP